MTDLGSPFPQTTHGAIGRMSGISNTSGSAAASANAAYPAAGVPRDQVGGSDQPSALQSSLANSTPRIGSRMLLRTEQDDAALPPTVLAPSPSTARSNADSKADQGYVGHRPVVPHIETNQLPQPAVSRNSLFYTPSGPPTWRGHARNISGSSQTFGASSSSLSLASMDSAGRSSSMEDGPSNGAPQWMPNFECSLNTPTCELKSASSIRSRRNWDEFEGKPVSPLPSPNAQVEESTSSMFDRPLLSSNGMAGSSTRNGGSLSGRQNGKGGRDDAEPETPSKTSAFFGASWASLPRGPSSLLSPPRRTRMVSSSDATDGTASTGGWSSLPASRAVSMELGRNAQQSSVSPSDTGHRHMGARKAFDGGPSTYSSHGRFGSGGSTRSSDLPYSPFTVRDSDYERAASSSSTSAGPYSGLDDRIHLKGPQTPYDGLPATDFALGRTSVRDQLDEGGRTGLTDQAFAVERAMSSLPSQRLWLDLDGSSRTDLAFDVGGSAFQLSLPPGTPRQARASRHAHGPSENATGSSLSPHIGSVAAGAGPSGAATSTRTATAIESPSLPHGIGADEVREEEEHGDVIGPYRKERVLGVGAFSQVALGRAIRPVSFARRASSPSSERTPPASVDHSAAHRVYNELQDHRISNGPSVNSSGEPADGLVALKMLDREPCSQNERLKVSWIREVEVLKHLSHPNLVRFVTAFSTPRHHTLVLEHVSGGELFELLAQHQDKLAQREWLVRRIFGELANAVGWMHNANLVHRDIKLENILLTTSLFKAGEDALTPTRLPLGPLVKLTDFGLSRFIDPSDPGLETRCGSEEYAAPELIIGKRYDGRKTDAWALGVLLYALVTGSLPFLEDVSGQLNGFSAPREGQSGDRDAKQRKSHLLRIAKGDLRWPAKINQAAADRPSADVCPANLRLVTPVAKLMVARLLRRDSTKRAGVWETWDEEWMLRGSFSDAGPDVLGESSAAGERFEMLPDPRSERGQAWLDEHASFRHGQVSRLACDD